MSIIHSTFVTEATNPNLSAWQPALSWIGTPIPGQNPYVRFCDYSGLETAFITAHRLIRKHRRGIGENDERRVSLLGLRLPVIDDRDGPGCAFVHGEIHQ